MGHQHLNTSTPQHFTDYRERITKVIVPVEIGGTFAPVLEKVSFSTAFLQICSVSGLTLRSSVRMLRISPRSSTLISNFTMPPSSFSGIEGDGLESQSHPSRLRLEPPAPPPALPSSAFASTVPSGLPLSPALLTSSPWLPASPCLLADASLFSAPGVYTALGVGFGVSFTGSGLVSVVFSAGFSTGFSTGLTSFFGSSFTAT